MRKIIVLLFISLTFYGCSSSKKLSESLDSWMGSSKSSLIMQWGPPTQTTSDGKDGEILIYAKRVYYQLAAASNPVDYWEYRMLYANGLGTLYHWLYRRNPNPPERIDVRILTR